MLKFPEDSKRSKFEYIRSLILYYILVEGRIYPVTSPPERQQEREIANTHVAGDEASYGAPPRYGRRRDAGPVGLRKIPNRQPVHSALLPAEAYFRLNLRSTSERQ